MMYKSLDEVFTNPMLFSKTHKYEYSKGELMYVEVIGHRSKVMKDLLARAVEFYCSKLMTKRMCQSLEVYVILKKKLENDFAGYCSYLDHHKGVRQFEIELCKNQSVRETLSSLAHEVVHLKQFALGELKDTMHPGNISVWQGQKINEDKVDYWDLPFEIEAYGRERGLYTRFAIQENLSKELLDSKLY